METLTIDCATCTMQGTDACDDCVVTFLCGVPAHEEATTPRSAVVVTREPVVLERGEAAALRLLGDSGLVPPIRHRPTPPPPGTHLRAVV